MKGLKREHTVWACVNTVDVFYFLNTTSSDENEERSMVEPASLENSKVRELQEVSVDFDKLSLYWIDSLWYC